MRWVVVLVLAGCGRIAFDPTSAMRGADDGGDDGGGNNDSLPPDTWRALTVTTGALPPARSSAGMAYDSDRERVVMYGGLCGCDGIYLDDTWEFDGTTWTQTATGGPTALVNMAMQYDPVRKRVVMFGGTDGPLNWSADTYEYDGTSWTKVSVTGPQGRVGIASSYNPVLGEMFIYGGSEMTTYFADTWSYAGTWTDETDVVLSPTARVSSAMAWDGNRSVMFGGNGSDLVALDETWTLTGTAWAEPSLSTTPAGRTDEAMAGEPARSRIVMLGGLIDGVATDETWVFDGAWTQLPSGPSARADAGMVYDDALDAVVMFGGNTGGTAVLGDMWILR